MRIILSAIFAICFLSFGAQATNNPSPPTSRVSQQASFDCRTASNTVEKLICSDANLSDKDRELAKLWQTPLGSYSGNQRNSLIKGERNWLKLRMKACNVEPENGKSVDYAACLNSVYDQRLEMLNEQLEVHNKAPNTDFDEILDTQFNLSDYYPQKMGGMYLKSDSDYDYSISYVPLTCRELYTLNSGNWDYSPDTIGSNAGSFAKTSCAFMILSGLVNSNSSAKTEPSLSQALDKAVALIQDEAEIHKITKVKFGDFTKQNRKEALVTVFSNSSGTLHFHSLYFGFYDESKKEFELEHLDVNTPFPKIQ